MLVGPVCFNSATCFSGSTPSTGNCNPCSNQDQSFTKECLNSVSWDFPSLHSFQMLNMASSQPLYVSQVCSIHTIIAGEKKSVSQCYEERRKKRRKNSKPAKRDFLDSFSVNTDPSLMTGWIFCTSLPLGTDISHQGLKFLLMRT